MHYEVQAQGNFYLTAVNDFLRAIPRLKTDSKFLNDPQMFG